MSVDDRDRRAAEWVMVVACNVVIPGLFGWTMTAHGGRVGMAFGVAIVWVMGRAVCVHLPRWGEMVLRGGYVLAFFQFLPIVHLVAGGLAIASVAGVVGDFPFDRGAGAIQDEICALAVTVLTAQFLLVVASGIGYLTEPGHTTSHEPD